MTTPWIPPAVTTSTDSTAALYAALRAHALAFVDPAVAVGQNLAQLLAAAPSSGIAQARLFVRSVPNVGNVVYPYATLLLERATIIGTNGDAERATLEVQVVANPISQGPLCEFIADRLERCFLSLRLSSGPLDATNYGLVVCRNRQRATVPPFTTPADANVYGVRMVFDLWMYPRVLTSRPR